MFSVLVGLQFRYMGETTLVEGTSSRPLHVLFLHFSAFTLMVCMGRLYDSEL